MNRVIAAFIDLALVAGAAFAQDTIRIGVNLELSGRMAPSGNESLLGAQVALSQQPEVLGKKVESSIYDNATSVDGSVACANRFADEGVVAVIGAHGSSHSIPAAQVLQANGIVMIATGSTNPAVTQTGDYILRVPYSDVFEGEVTGLYAYNELGARRAVIFNQQDDDYSTGLSGYFRDALLALPDFPGVSGDITCVYVGTDGTPADRIMALTARPNGTGQKRPDLAISRLSRASHLARRAGSEPTADRLPGLFSRPNISDLRPGVVLRAFCGSTASVW